MNSKGALSGKIALMSLLSFALPAAAGPVNGLTSFTAGTPARAAEVNGNFTAVKTAVDDNHTRIGTIEGVNAAARITALEGANAAARLTALETSPSVTGNLTLAPSTATAGNILKGAVPFLHDFGTDNTFLGENAGNFTMSGSENTATGAAALVSNTIGGNNTASGVNALANNTSGNNNTANGLQALFSNTTGTGNTANGLQALFSNTTGNNNTASGLQALFNNTTGTGNIAIGNMAGFLLTTGDENITIGSLGNAGETRTIRIGASQTRAFIAGIRGVATDNANAINVVIDAAGQLGTINSSRRVKDDIADMGEASGVLMKLRPVTFHYKSDRNPKGRTLQYGLIAEEVAQVTPGLVARSATGEIETVYYQHLAPMLLNEVQKQQRTIAAQAAALAAQTARVAALEREALEIAELKRELAKVTAVLSRLEQPERVARGALKGAGQVRDHLLFGPAVDRRWHGGQHRGG